MTESAEPVDNQPRTAPATTFVPSKTSRAAWITLLLSAVFALAIDLGSKSWAFASLADDPVHVVRDDVLAAGPQRLHMLIPPHEPTVVVPHVLQLQLVLNSGAVFGTGQGKRWLFVPFAFVAVGFCLWMFAHWTDRRDRLSHACIGLVIAGGVGNLYDRLLFACVRDFLHPLPTARLPLGLSWPNGDDALWPYVSNVADAFLIIGIGLLIIRMWRAPAPIRQPAP